MRWGKTHECGILKAKWRKRFTEDRVTNMPKVKIKMRTKNWWLNLATQRMHWRSWQSICGEVTWVKLTIMPEWRSLFLSLQSYTIRVVLTDSLPHCLLLLWLSRGTTFTWVEGLGRKGRGASIGNVCHLFYDFSGACWVQFDYHMSCNMLLQYNIV